LALKSLGQALSTPENPVFYFRCFPHILNLAVQDGLDALGSSLQKIKGISFNKFMG